MNVNFDAANVVEDALLGADDAAQVRIKSLRNISRDPWLAAFGAEDDVQKNLGKGPWHEWH